MADFLDRPAIGLMHYGQEQQEDDRVDEKGTEQRGPVFSPSGPLALETFGGGVNRKGNRDISAG